MSARDQVIDIERNENISIDVSSPVVETVTEVNIFGGWKRIIIGTSLILAMVLSLIGGTIASYLLRKDLHEPVDPYNVWPNTDYKNQCRPEYVVAEDMGYSDLPNNHLLIRNGKKNYFTVSNGSNYDMFMSVYMIENLFGSKDYSIHVVSSPNKSDLSPVADFSFLQSHWDLRKNNNMISFTNTYEGLYGYYQESGIFLAEKLINGLPTSPVQFADQNTAMNVIATEINKCINSNINQFYHLTNKKTGSYIFSSIENNGAKFELFEKLKNLRNAKSAEAKKEKFDKKKTSKAPKILEKPRFKNIQMLTLAELSN